MPEWVTVIVMAVVFTSVISVLQGMYWTWVARQERQQNELLRRLGGADGSSIEATIFLEQENDAAADALGSIGNRMSQLLMQADAGMSVSNLLTRMSALGGVGLLVGGMVLGPLGMMMGLPLAAAPYMLLKRRAKKRTSSLVEQLPDSLELMSRSLQAGLGLNDAFRLVAEEMPMPVAGEFGRVFEEVRFGRDYREAFTKMLERNPGVFDLRLMVSSVLLQRETGGNLIEILENISETIRGRFVFHAKVRAMTAEAKISALILGSLPLMVAGLLSVMNPEYLIPLFEDIKGHFILAAASILYTAGIMIMRDLSNVDV
jgi:tight adherence protein B